MSLLYTYIAQWRAVTSEAGHAIYMQYFTNGTKKLSEMGQKNFFITKIFANEDNLY